jgi:hypothetical protein
MIECRHCRDVFRQPITKLGARCPTCRMPLFEKDRQRPPVVDLGPCAVHANNSAAAKCQRCGKMMCTLCRTRWGEEIVCVSCLDLSLQKGDVSPDAVRMQNRQAVRSFVLALCGWAVLLLTFWPLAALFRSNFSQGSASMALVLFFGSCALALFAVGQASACIIARGQRLVLATCGLSLAGLHIGVCLGLAVLNVWNH